MNNGESTRLAQQMLEVLAAGGSLQAAQKLALLLANESGGSQVLLAWNNPPSRCLTVAGWSRFTGPLQKPSLDGEASLLTNSSWRLLGEATNRKVWWQRIGENSAAGLSPEVTHLAAQVMFAACHLEAKLQERKLDALAEYAAGAGHEINNPLGSIIGRVAQLRKQESDPEKQRTLDTIGAQAYRIRDMIGDSMLFARPPEVHLEQVDWAALLQQAADRQRDFATERNVLIQTSCESDLASDADPVQMAVVLAELLRNAVQASPPGSRVDLIAESFPLAQGMGVEIQVSDQGTGFTSGEREHAFDPFFSGSQAGRGLGFGLSKCWRIVQQHGGNLNLHSDSGGTRFQIWLPQQGQGQ